jgi:uncharacterized repeat protein (TIGR02543 family)
VNAGAALAALLPPETFTLSVTKSGSGSGTVTSNPTGIDCGTSCSAEYTGGETVTLTADADLGSTFSGWSGACSGNQLTCVLDMDQDKAATATFSTSVQTYSLTVSKSGSGGGSVTSNPAGIDCGSSCSAEFTSGETVTLTAEADVGSTFSGWSGDCAGTTSSCELTMNKDMNVTATFSSPIAFPIKVFLPLIMGN